MMLDMRSLEIAAAVVECGSMSEAALRFGLTQSAVSQAVRRAEDSIGAPLLHRERRPLVPTNAGRVLVNQVRDFRREIERVIEATRAAAVLPERQQVRLGLVDSVAGTVGAYFVKELMDESLALRLTTWSGLSFSHTDALIRHAIDAAVTSDPMEGLTEMTQYPVLCEPFVLVAPKSLSAGLRGRDLRDILASHNLVRHSARSHMGQQVERQLRRLQIDPPMTLEFDTSDAIIAMVSTGNGVAITTPLCVLQGAMYVGGVEVLPLPSPMFVRHLSLATRRGELVGLGERMAMQLRRLIVRRAMPQMLVFAPWLGELSSDIFAANADSDRRPDVASQ